MPEYLAPGVYVEEIELGPRPIEGVSTSTTGFVGFTRRGPLNKPTLITNFGEFYRFFGGFLDPNVYKDKRWVPFAVQGFFANGGARAYVVRTALWRKPPEDESLADRARYAHVAETILPVQQFARRSLAADAQAGATVIALAYAGGLPVGTPIAIGDGADAEVVRVTGFGVGVTIAPPLRREHTAGSSVTELELPEASATTIAAVPNVAGASELRVAAVDNLVDNRWLRVGEEEETEYVQALAVPDGPGAGQVPLGQPLQRSHGAGTPVVMAQESALATTITTAAGAGTNTLTLDDVTGLNVGELIVLGGADAEVAQIATVDPLTQTVTVEPDLRFDHGAGAEVQRLSFNAPVGEVTVETTLVPGVRLAAALDDVRAGDWIAIGSGDEQVYVRLAMTIDADAADLSLAADLDAVPDANAEVRRLELPALTTALAADTGLAATTLTPADEGRVTPGKVLEILDGAQTEYADVLAIDGGDIILARPLRYVHRQGTRLRVLGGAIRVTAGPAIPDPSFYPEVGSWGNDIRLTVETDSILTTGVSTWVAGDPFVELETANGVEPGTVLRFPGNAYAVVNRVEGRQVFLQAGAPAPPDPMPAEAQVSTVEFKLTASYEDRDEVFDRLSMDPRHSRCFEKIINRASELIHVQPEADLPAPPDNLPLATVRWPSGGNDGLDGANYGMIIGADSSDADRRTGLWAMLNAARVSLVTVPGITDQAVQLALIGHCERARYRFAVLDSEEGATLDGVVKQRNRYDSKYAALYYPWLKVYDPLTGLQTYAPPSGYVAGLYARTDQEVGVHKAPANAVLRDVLDLQFTIGKGQQDILNPLGINAARAFPGRGIRMWGARTISSDSLWRYVNVRRLFIFLEQSIDESTQYAVFEPNDVPLWNRLKAAVTDFLTVVWRSGALQGLTAEEAFFVRCGLGESMIQADIDAGQVIMVIGVAPVKPAEFVIFRIGQKAGAAAQ